MRIPIKKQNGIGDYMLKEYKVDFSNFIYQFIYQFVILGIPLIIAPYLTRTIKAEGLGVYTYSNSIAYYFVMLSMLGISTYGQRLIAQSSNDLYKLRISFWSLYFDHLIFSLFSLCVYYVYVFYFVIENKDIFYINSLFVISSMFDLTWVYYGLEEFKRIVLRNFCVKLFELLFIILLVRDVNDLLIYALIVAVFNCIGNVVMFPTIYKKINPIQFGLSEMKVHIKPLLLFSVSIFAVSLYTIFDKTLLGILSSKEDVAFYEYSNKLINLPKMLVAVIGTIFMPKACKLANEHSIESVKKLIKTSLYIASCISFGSIFGLIGIADMLVYIYYGAEFSPCAEVVIWLSPVIAIVGLGDVIRKLCMIPMHMDLKFNICIVINAIINLIINIILIPKIGIYGAIFGTLGAEIFGLSYQLICCKDFCEIGYFIVCSLPFFVFGLILLGWLNFLKEIFVVVCLKNLIIIVALGTIIYLFLVLIYHKFFRIYIRDNGDL